MEPRETIVPPDRIGPIQAWLGRAAGEKQRARRRRDTEKLGKTTTVVVDPAAWRVEHSITLATDVGALTFVYGDVVDDPQMFREITASGQAQYLRALTAEQLEIVRRPAGVDPVTTSWNASAWGDTFLKTTAAATQTEVTP